MVTALAFLYFKQQHCDLVVLEVGLGGRLDATDVIDPPEIAVITNLALEHTEVLGDTHEQIAFEKAGIIKAGADVVLYHQQQAAKDIVLRRCSVCGITPRITDPSAQKLIRADLEGQCFT